MEAALFQDTPALLAAQLDPKTQKAAEEAFAQQQRSNPRQLASELVACLGNAPLKSGVRQLAATLSKRIHGAARRALGALGEWNHKRSTGLGARSGRPWRRPPSRRSLALYASPSRKRRATPTSPGPPRPKLRRRPGRRANNPGRAGLAAGASCIATLSAAASRSAW